MPTSSAVRTLFFAALWVIASLAAAPVRADDSAPLLSSVEIAPEIGIFDRGTTGVGAPVLGYGYDHGGGAMFGAGARLFFHSSDNYFRQGIELRAAHETGDGLALTVFDLAYALRVKFPCMSDGERNVFGTGLLGVTTALGEAGLGDGSRDARWNDRVVASETLDHVGLGWLLAVGVDVHLGALFAGPRLDVREHFAITDGPVSRDFEIAATVRIGGEIELGGGSRSYEPE